MHKDIKYLVLSDIHLGHPKNTTTNIIHNLETFFINYHKDIQDIDILFLAGDIFDRLLSSRSSEYRLIMNWLSNILLWCKQNNVIFRILHGTPSHDNDQVASFTDIAKKLAPDANYKYVDTLSIEYIEQLGIHVLYVPDEWRHEASTTLEEVKELLKEYKISEVDVAIMHGCFRYQLPVVKDAKFTHNETEYLNIVKYYINIGHIHKSSAYERILAPGSFDRLAHSEEEPKGGLLCKIKTDKSMEFKFLENTLACIFKTLTYKDHNESEITKDLKSKLKKFKKGSHIRIEINNDNMLLKNLRDLAGNYPDLNIKFKTEVETIKQINLLEDLEYKPFEINKTNIKELMLKELGEVDKNTLSIFLEELDIAVGG